MNGIFLVQLSFALCLLDTLIPLTTEALENVSNKPNFIFILADDMGFNDASFHGSDQIPTPNIDALMYNGVMMKYFYSLPVCSPSRAALLTGKYPIHTHMQNEAINPSEPRGLPLKEKIMPQYLKTANYIAHLVGKWHLGYCKRKYTPLSRGFDSHFGFYNGLQDYFDHTVAEPYTLNKGIDMRQNMTVAWDTQGKYSTYLYTEEAVRLIKAHHNDQPFFLYLAYNAPHSGNQNQLLQAPADKITNFSYIDDEDRRTYAAMVSIMDEGIGKIMEALKRRDMLENSVVFFISDNGAPTNGFLANHGSNYPLRGIKNTAWEGGVRVLGGVWSPLIKKPKRILKDPIHITDLLPTVLSLAGIDNTNNQIDGFNMWPTIAYDEPSPRKDVLINIDDKERYEAIRVGQYKYVNGQTTSSSEWVGDSGRSPSEKRPPYLPETVLNSKAGVAIAAVTTDNNNSALTSEEILKLRQEAEVHCNVTEAEKVQCRAWLSPCLFDLERDPCEMINIIKQEPSIAKDLKNTLDEYRKTMVQPNNKWIDWKASPWWWNGTWVCWKDPNQKHIFTNKFAALVYIEISIVVAPLTIASLILK